VASKEGAQELSNRASGSREHRRAEGCLEATSNKRDCSKEDDSGECAETAAEKLETRFAAGTEGDAMGGSR